MHFNLVTIFPEFFDSPLSVGLLGKAIDKGLVTIERFTPRNMTTDRHQTVDDKPYGGGAGLVMMLEPLSKTLRQIENTGRMLLLSPKGRKLDQQYARELSIEKNITLICGRYEGVDQRLLDIFPIEEVSVGDMVLNGGETGALCVIEAVSRLLPDFMHKEESHHFESFSDGLLEHPQYTRPEEFEGAAVPEIVRSGDHGRIATWQREKSLEITLKRRPDLLASALLSPADITCLKQCKIKSRGRNLFLALIHFPVVNKFGKKVTVSLTNLDIHDMSRCSRSYSLAGFFAVTPLEDQQKLAQKLIDYWTCGAGSEANPDRARALAMAEVVSSLDGAIEIVRQKTGRLPRLVATSAVANQHGAGEVAVSDVTDMLEKEPVLLLFGTGFGLAKEVVERCQLLRPLRYLDEYNHLSVRSAVSIYVDRILGDTY